MKTRYIGKHIKKCGALRNFHNGTWTTPWACPEHVFADAIGRFSNRGHHSWIKWRCNHTSCKAEFMVSDEDVLLLIQAEGEGLK